MSKAKEIAMKVYGVLSRGGLDYKESLVEMGILKEITEEAALTIVSGEDKKTLLHELAIHGLLGQVDKKLLTKKNLSVEDKNTQSPISYAIRYQCLNQIPKELLTKDLMEKKVKGVSLVQTSAWAGQLDKVPLKSLNNANLTTKDSDGDSPLASVMEMVDYLAKNFQHYYSSPTIKENYKALLPKLLEKLESKTLKEYKSYASQEGLIQSLEVINKEAKNRALRAVTNSKQTLEI